MDKTKRIKMKDASSGYLYLLFEDYVKETIARDLEDIFEKGARLLNGDEPWVFRLSAFR